MSKFREFVRFIKKNGTLEEVAIEAGTTPLYLEGPLYKGYKTPKKDLWKNLVKISNGRLTDADMVDHFIRRTKKEGVENV